MAKPSEGRSSVRRSRRFGSRSERDFERTSRLRKNLTLLAVMVAGCLEEADLSSRETRRKGFFRSLLGKARRETV
jgi:hypothetical protein